MDTSHRHFLPIVVVIIVVIVIKKKESIIIVLLPTQFIRPNSSFELYYRNVINIKSEKYVSNGLCRNVCLLPWATSVCQNLCLYFVFHAFYLAWIFRSVFKFWPLGTLKTKIIVCIKVAKVQPTD